MRLIDAHALYDNYMHEMENLVHFTVHENVDLEALSLLCGAKLITDAPTIGNWISVKDRLPGKKATVIVSLVNEIDGHRMKYPQLGYPADDEGKMWFIIPWSEWAVDSDFEVTHWMPLPTPPGGES